LPLDAEVGIPKVFDVVDVMPERCEPQPFIRKGCLPYAFLRALQVRRTVAGVFPWLSRRFPVLCPFRGGHTVSFLTLCSGPVLQTTHSLRPAPFPPPSPLTVAHQSLCSRASSVLRSCPTSCDRALPSCFLEFTARTTAPSAMANRRTSRFPCEKRTCVRGVYDHAGPDCLSRYRDSPCCLPLVLIASAPWMRVFSRLNTRPTCPLSTLRRRPHGRRRMTRGRCGSLLLHRMRLSLTISRRF
jgi:hypothetical protein